MKYLAVAAFTVILAIPGFVHAMGFNPFKSGSDNPPPPSPSRLNSVVTPQSENGKTVPIPGTALAFGLGFLGLATWQRYRRP